MASLHLAQEIFKLIYPVGSIYLSTSTTNPSTYFGGTWEQVAKGSYLLGYSANNTWFDKPGQSKGSANGPGNWNTNNHTLTIDQMPNHIHGFQMAGTRLDTNGDGSMRMQAAVNAGSGNFWNVSLARNGAGSHDGSMTGTGGGKGHNHFHVSPYYIVVVWKRTA